METALVTVEADVANGLPSFQIVGLPDTAIQEARERVRAAIRNSGFEFPLRRVTVNLAPAERRKEGTGFDLAIALAILRASGQLAADPSGLCLGELALDGALRPVRGTMPRVRRAMEAGIDEASFRSCLESGRGTAAVDKDAADGDAVGVNGTPAFFVNGRPLSGALPYETFKEAIDEAMVQRRSPATGQGLTTAEGARAGN